MTGVQTCALPISNPNPVESDASDSKTAASRSPAVEPAIKEAEVAPRPQRPPPSEAPAANVVLFRPGTSEPKTPSLSPVERRAFRELAQELTARLQGGRDNQVADSVASRLLAEGVSVEVAETALTPPDADPISAEPVESLIAPPNAEPIAAEPAEALALPVAEVIDRKSVV